MPVVRVAGALAILRPFRVIGLAAMAPGPWACDTAVAATCDPASTAPVWQAAFGA